MGLVGKEWLLRREAIWHFQHIAFGHKRGLDMPNVVFAFTYLVTQQMNLIVVDPNYTGRDEFANIINVSHAMRKMFEWHNY